jgi:hypothetical protein
MSRSLHSSTLTILFHLHWIGLCCGIAISNVFIANQAPVLVWTQRRYFRMSGLERELLGCAAAFISRSIIVFRSNNAVTVASFPTPAANGSGVRPKSPRASRRYLRLSYRYGTISDDSFSAAYYPRYFRWHQIPRSTVPGEANHCGVPVHG